MPARIEDYVSARQVGGHRIVFFERGTGPALLLIHGMFGDHLDWEPVLLPLSENHRVIALDLPGFGDSAKPDCAYSEDFFLEALRELLAQRDAERVALVGNSFGGILSVLYALRYPQQIERLVLVSSGGLRAMTEEEKGQTRRRLSEDVILSLTAETVPQLFAPVFAKHTEQRRRYLQKQAAKLGRPDYPAYARALARSINTVLFTNLLEPLPALRCPTLLLWGEQDQVFPLENARRARARLPEAELVSLPGCGHAPQLECPGEFLQALQGFLSRPGRA